MAGTGLDQNTLQPTKDPCHESSYDWMSDCLPKCIRHLMNAHYARHMSCCQYCCQNDNRVRLSADASWLSRRR